MTKEKLLSLTKYSNDLISKLKETKVPDKHKNRPGEYRAFLQRELKIVNTKLDEEKFANKGAEK